MPPIGRNVVDAAAVSAVRDWIQTLPVDSGSGNRAPVAYDDDTSTLNGVAVELNLKANDADADGDVLTLTNLGSPTNGSLQNLGGGIVRYTSNGGFTGEDSFTYAVVDVHDAVSNAAMVRIRVLPSASASSATFTDASSRLAEPSLASGVAMAVADMNGDGRDDLVRLDDGYDLSIEHQGADGRFTTRYLGTVSDQRQWSLSVGDADNNGMPDILTGGYYDGLSYYRANTTASAYTRTLLTSPLIFCQATSFADINDDGWLDIFACHDDADNAKFRNLGNGQMQADSNLISHV